MEIKKIINLVKTLSLIFFMFILASCNKETKTRVENIKLDQVSILGNDYGMIVRPPVNVKRKIVKNKDYSLFTYNIGNNKNIDSLVVYDDGNVMYENKKLILVDVKKIKINNKEIVVKKLYVPKDDFVGTDSNGSSIIYISDDGLIASYGLYFHIIFFYDSNKYSELQKSILNNSYNFKRHQEESNGKP